MSYLKEEKVFVVCDYNNDSGSYDIFMEIFSKKEDAVTYIEKEELIHPMDKGKYIPEHLITEVEVK